MNDRRKFIDSPQNRMRLENSFVDKMLQTVHRIDHRGGRFGYTTRCLRGAWGVACILDNLLGDHNDVRAFPFGFVCKLHDRWVGRWDEPLVPRRGEP